MFRKNNGMSQFFFRICTFQCGKSVTSSQLWKLYCKLCLVFSLFAVNSAWFLLCSLDCLVAGFLFCGGRLFCAHIPVGFLWLHMHTNTFPPSVSKSFMEKSAAENKTYWNNGTSLTIQSISELLNLLCTLSVCMLIKSGYFYCFLCGGCVVFFRGCQGCVYLGWVCESTHDVITF